MKTVEYKKVGRVCPVCGADLVYRHNKFNQEFIGCSAYPECTYAEFPNSAVEKLDEKCPLCGLPLVIKTSRFGKKFIGCSGYPKCHYMRNVNQTAEQAAEAAKNKPKFAKGKFNRFAKKTESAEKPTKVTKAKTKTKKA
jgi:DNA topoisomerase-1